MQLNVSKWLNYFIILSIFSLSACSQKFSDSFSTLNASLDSFIDVELTPEQLIDIPYDSAFVRVNDSKQVLMILAIIEENKLKKTQKLKWVSADNRMIITESGRIIKTQGFDNNLMNIHFSSESDKNFIETDKKAHLYYDWMPDYRYQFSAESESHLIGKELKKLQSWSVSSRYVTENINFLELASSITNHYWLNENNKIISSIQHLGPNMEKIEMSYVKDFIPSK